MVSAQQNLAAVAGWLHFAPQHQPLETYFHRLRRNVTNPHPLRSAYDSTLRMAGRAGRLHQPVPGRYRLCAIPARHAPFSDNAKKWVAENRHE